VKKILVDAGTFYTKVYVLRQAFQNGGEGSADKSYEFYGRTFFPTLVGRAGDIDKSRIYYEHDGEWFSIGYDCSSSLELEQIVKAFEDDGVGTGSRRLILKKIIYDFADHKDDLAIDVVVSDPRGIQVFEEIRAQLHDREIEITALRGYDRRRIKKEVKIRFRLLSAGEAITGFLEKIKKDFRTALVVDVGYHRTKIYLVECGKGVALFQIGDFGVSFFYEKIVNLCSEKKITDNHFLWLVKQIEFGYKQVEVGGEDNRGVQKLGGLMTGDCTREYDISLVLDNVRWDLNKDIKRLTTDILTSYYTNTTTWAEMLVVTGGGASLNGDILCHSLVEDGYRFHDVYIEKQPIYTMLEGACRGLNTLQANRTPI